MNILIVGLGEVGTYLARVLSTEGHTVTVVDRDGPKLKRIVDLLDVGGIQGDGSRPDVLDRADAPSMDLVLAVSNDDRVNMLTCLFGKRMGAKKTVLRLKDTTAFRRSKTFFRKNLMYDLLLSLDDLAAEEVVKTVRLNQAIGAEFFADGRVQMRRFKIDEGSPFAGVPLKDMKIPEGVLITAIDREQDVVIPGGSDAANPGDEIFVLGEANAISAFEKRVGVRAAVRRNIVVYGSVGVAIQVCEALQGHGIQPRVIVEDREEAEHLSEVLTGSTVLHAESTDIHFLQEEHVGETDAFLGLAEQDERNLISCQLAKQLGAALTVALVRKPDYVSLYQRLGIDVAVSPRLLCANRILAFVRSRSISSIATIEEGKAEVLEVEVHPGSRLIGRKIKDAGLPRGCVIGAITRENGDVVIPHGEDAVEAHDQLVLFALAGVVEQVLGIAGVERS